MKELVAILACLFLAVPCAARIITVDDDAPNDAGPGNPSVSDPLEDGSAEHPLDSIQEAIERANHGDIVKVCPGVYFESINFYGKAITVTGADPNNSATVAATVIKRREEFPSDTVRFDCGEDNSSVLRGFTIEAVDSARGKGFGIYCHRSSPLISNMVIGYHKTGVKGESAQPVLFNNYIHDNSRSAIEVRDGRITNCTIKNNGAYGLYDCDGSIVNCIISYNAGIGLYDCDGLIRNCVISGNSGGLQGCSGEVRNCTIVYNATGSGLQSCHGEIRNCIIASNGRYGLDNCRGTVKYNNVWGNALGNYADGTLPGARDIHADPFFTGPDDYHLKSEAGRWDSGLKMWVRDDVTSLCIDAGGDRCTPPQVEPRPNGDRINQGAYGGTVEASKSPYREAMYSTEGILGNVGGGYKVKVGSGDFAAIPSYQFKFGLEPNIVAGEWAAGSVWPGNNNDNASDIAVDAEGNVYVTGGSKGPGGDYDYATIKYGPNGNQLWEARYNGPGNGDDYANAIAIDAFGNAYVTGSGKGAGGKYDYVTIKYAPNGNQLWAARYSAQSTGSDSTNTITIDSAGNIYVTGSSKGTGTWQDYCKIKYDPDGKQLWVAAYSEPGNGWGGAHTVAIEDSGDVYMTGYSIGSGGNYDYATIRYDPDGSQLWVARYNGPANGDDYANAIAIDRFGNVYVTGYTTGLGTYRDYATIKYDPKGNELWVARYNRPGKGDDSANAIAIDRFGNVYVTGSSIGAGGDYDYATVKYGPNGNQLWVTRYNGPGSGYVRAMP